MKESAKKVNHVNSKRRHFLPIGSRFLKQRWFVEGSLWSPACPVKRSLIFNPKCVGIGVMILAEENGNVR